jgi:hypothetical protein
MKRWIAEVTGDTMTQTRWLHLRTWLPSAVVLAAYAVALISAPEAVAQSAPPKVNCASSKPVTVDTAQFATLYRVLSAVPGAAKSEWETTPAYIARRQEAMNVALSKSGFRCPRIVVKVPLVWKFDANTGLLNTYSGGYSAKGQISLDSLEADLGPNTGGMHSVAGGLFDDIYIGESSIEAEFQFSVSRYNAAPRPKSATTISKCLQGALSYPGMYGYELRSAWCREQHWSVELRIADTFMIPGSYKLPIEDAKRLRETGAFLYLDVTLNYNYIGVSDMQNEWLMFSSLEDAWIGDSSGAKIGAAATIPMKLDPAASIRADEARRRLRILQQSDK